jgi:hypothetical protein
MLLADRDAIATSPSASARTSIVRTIRPNVSSNKIEQCRRIATRYDKLAANDPTIVQHRIDATVAPR